MEHGTVIVWDNPDYNEVFLVWPTRPVTRCVTPWFVISESSTATTWWTSP